MAEPRLLHFGSAVVDFVYRLTRLPKPGDDIIASSFQVSPGGGYNMMVAARRSGLSTAYAGLIGDGMAGAVLDKAFREEGIDRLQPPLRGEDSGVCIVLVTDDAERTFVSRPGAECRLTSAALSSLATTGDDWFFTSGYTLAYPECRHEQARFIATLPVGSPFVFDPTGIVASIPPPILAQALSRADWLSCNRGEAEVIAGRGSCPEMAARLLEVHCPMAKGVVVRAGSEGAWLACRGEAPVFVPAFAVRTVDTNGAGDCHVGAFVAALATGLAPHQAVCYANAAAALSTECHGGATAPTRQQVDQFLKRAGRK